MVYYIAVIVIYNLLENLEGTWHQYYACSMSQVWVLMMQCWSRCPEAYKKIIKMTENTEVIHLFYTDNIIIEKISTRRRKVLKVCSVTNYFLL